MTDKVFGKIITPYKVHPEPHEIATAEFFNKLGKDVEFILPNRSKGIKNADIKMDDIFWEIKSPISNGKHTIEHIFRKAFKQSNNIIFDLRRTKMSESKSISQIKYNFKLIKRINRLLIITKYNQLIELKK